MKFITPVSMRITQEQYEKDLKKPLLSIGYEISKFSNFLPESDTLVTNAFGENNQVCTLEEKCKRNNNRYFIDHYNPKLFLALAAMTDKSYRVGEYYSQHGKVFKVLKNNTLVYGDGVKKATKEEIINCLTSIQNKNMQKIKRSHFKEIVDVACISWKSKLLEEAEKADILSEEIELSNDFVNSMIEAAIPSQKKIIFKYLSEPKEDRNPFIKNINSIDFSEINKMLFGDDKLIELSVMNYNGRKDLRKRSLYINNKIKVILHETDEEATIIEFQKK